MAKQTRKVSTKSIEKPNLSGVQTGAAKLLVLLGELEKRVTFSSKKEFLENAIKDAEGKFREKLEKLLEKINRAIDEEGQLAENAKQLEHRLAVKEGEPEEEKKPEVTYAGNRTREPVQEPSGLEREVVADRPAIEEKVVFGGTANKELFTRDISYMQHHIAGEKVISTLIFYLRREGLDPTRFGTSSAEQQILAQKVTEYFGGTVPVYAVQNYLTSLQQSGLPSKQEAGQKYKLKLPDARE